MEWSSGPFSCICIWERCTKSSIWVALFFLAATAQERHIATARQLHGLTNCISAAQEGWAGAVISSCSTRPLSESGPYLSAVATLSGQRAVLGSLCHLSSVPLSAPRTDVLCVNFYVYQRLGVFQRPLTLILLQKVSRYKWEAHCETNYVLLSAKKKGILCRSVAIEMGVGSQYFSKYRGQGSIWFSSKVWGVILAALTPWTSTGKNRKKTLSSQPGHRIAACFVTRATIYGSLRTLRARNPQKVSKRAPQGIVRVKKLQRCNF